MNERRTVLVLGAGASKPFGFPLGDELTRELVTQLVREDKAPWPSLVHAFTPSIVKIFQKHLALSDQGSIDAFLEHRAEFLDVGKAAIASALLPRETMKAVYPNSPTWYGYLAARLPKDLSKLDGRLSIVTFNYERSLEFYLHTTLKHRYGMDDAQAAIALGHLPIVHFHGSLGRLPEMSADGVQGCVSFGAQLNADELLRCKDQIRIVNEREPANNPNIEAAHALLSRAERVVFLGFGYDETNLRRLLSYGPTNGTGFSGTAYEMRKNEIGRTVEYMRSLGANTKTLDPDHGDVLDYLRETCLLD